MQTWGHLLVGASGGHSDVDGLDVALPYDGPLARDHQLMAMLHFV